MCLKVWVARGLVGNAYCSCTFTSFTTRVLQAVVHCCTRLSVRMINTESQWWIQRLSRWATNYANWRVEKWIASWRNCYSLRNTCLKSVLWLIVGCFAQFIVGEVDYKQNALNLFRSILPWSNSASCKCRWLRQTADYPLSNYPGSHTTTDDDEKDDDMTFHNPTICAFRPDNEEN